MKAVTTTSMTSAVIVALTIACAPSSITARQRSNEPGPFAAQGAGFSATLLRKMDGLTGFDVLQMLPAYSSRVSQRPSPGFTLIIDGTRTSYVDMLRSIRATDLLEIRVVSEGHTTATGSGAEIIVTTVGGRTKSR